MLAKKKLQNWNSNRAWINSSGEEVNPMQMSMEDCVRAVHACWMMTRDQPQRLFIFQTVLYGALMIRLRSLIELEKETAR
jgi:hypothetical protein